MNGSTYDGIMTGPIPDEFIDLICPGHFRNGMRMWDHNPLGEDHIWVCATCSAPTRIALLQCLLCEQWCYETRLAHVLNAGNSSENTRLNYICGECNG